MNSESKPVLKRLASLKQCDGDANTCLIGAEIGCCKNYSSCEPASVKPSVVRNVKRFIEKWREKTAKIRDLRYKAKHRKQNLTEEQRMRHKLEYHFMTPFEKYRKGRKPWKLAIQILKIIIVTIQVSVFAVDRFAFVSYFKHTEDTFHHLFLNGWNDDVYISYYSKQQIINGIHFANERYLDVRNIAIGTYWYYGKNKSQAIPMRLCTDYRNFVNATDVNAIINGMNKRRVCQDIGPAFDASTLIHGDDFFNRVDAMELLFKLDSIYLAGLKFLRNSECFTFHVVIRLDNLKNDGRLPVTLKSTPKLMNKNCPHFAKNARLISGSLKAFDILVILICATSCCLCVRSVVGSIRLGKKAKIYFKVYRNERLTKMDLFQLVNKWFIVIVISDCLSIVGSGYKLLIDETDMKYYNVCSVLFGLAVLLVWIGLLRFLTYLKAYNILMITLRVAAPNLLRFISCVIFIFLGFSFCGWIILGPYHTKFRTLMVTMECLFSLLNGDDMYPTFTKVSTRSGIAVLIFSKLYLYFFISFFIYMVLSTFISIVGDTYERLKDWGRLPQTRIQRFIEGKRKEPRRQFNSRGDCHRCVRSMSVRSMTAASNLPNIIPQFDSSLERSLKTSLSESQISVESASLE